jgi:hypothetical protein
MLSDSTSRLGASSSVAAASALPLLSEAAAVSNTASELLQQQHRENEVRRDEENCLEDSSELHDQDQDFLDPSQHLLDVSLQHHHQQHQDFFDSQDQHQEFIERHQHPDSVIYHNNMKSSSNTITTTFCTPMQQSSVISRNASVDPSASLRRSSSGSNSTPVHVHRSNSFNNNNAPMRRSSGLSYSVAHMQRSNTQTTNEQQHFNANANILQQRHATSTTTLTPQQRPNSNTPTTMLNEQQHSNNNNGDNSNLHQQSIIINNNTNQQRSSSIINNNNQQRSNTIISRPSSRVEDGSRPPSRSSRLDGKQHFFRPIDPDETQLNEFDSFNFVAHHEFDDDESFIGETQVEAATPLDPNVGPPEWDGANPDALLDRLRQLKESVYSPLGLRSFYKSYTVWSKLKADQRDKALAWFRKLPEHVKR